jgi:hypothetical protein
VLLLWVPLIIDFLYFQLLGEIRHCTRVNVEVTYHNNTMRLEPALIEKVGQRIQRTARVNEPLPFVDLDVALKHLPMLLQEDPEQVFNKV